MNSALRICEFFGVAVLAFAAADSLSSSEVLETIPLAGDTHHVQGIVVEGPQLWVTAVDTTGKRGLLMEFNLPQGKLKRTVEITDGVRYHPGGLSADATSLWIPLAEYTRTGSSVIERRNKKTLALEAQFAVPDHIGCVAVNPDVLVGGNWDARDLYVWDHAGKLMRKITNPAGTAFQDLKFFNGQLVGGGLLRDRSGAIDWIEFPSFKPLRHVVVGKTDRGLAYTHEGLAIAEGKLWLLPEDSPSRLFVFHLP